MVRQFAALLRTRSSAPRGLSFKRMFLALFQVEMARFFQPFRQVDEIRRHDEICMLQTSRYEA